MSRVKRFDDIDSDSDFDLDSHKGKPSHATLSFKTEATEKVHLDDDDTDSISIKIGSDASNSPRNSEVVSVARPLSPPSVKASTELRSTPVSFAANMPSKKQVNAPTGPKVENVTPVAPPKAVAIPPKASPTPAATSSNTTEQKSAVSPPIPTTTNIPPIFPKPTLTGASASFHSGEEDSQDVLFRAKLRLEEKRLNGPSVTTPLSRSATPRSQQRVTTPLRVSSRSTPTRTRTPEQRFHSPLEARSTSIGQPPKSTDPGEKRFENENARLQDEITFLRQENKKLRTATSTVDSAENMKSELALDMLRRQLLQNERDHYTEREELKREKEALQEQISQYVDQVEGSVAACGQYKSLYEEKVKELESVKSQFQELLQDVHNVEQKQKSLETQHADRLLAERENTERLSQLLEDAKSHRDQLQVLTTQLQKEIGVLKLDKKQLREEVLEEKERALSLDATRVAEIDALKADLQKMKRLMEEREKNHQSSVREQQRIQDIQLKRLAEELEERTHETQSLKVTFENIKADLTRALKQEKQLRMEVELQVKEMAQQHRGELDELQTRITESFENTIKRLREDLKMEREEKDGLHREVESVGLELQEARDSLSYYEKECKALSLQLGEVEQKRQLAESKCTELSNTLEELLAQDDMNASTVRNLQAALEDAQEELNLIKAQCGSTDSVIADIQRLSDENERLTSECYRLKEQRDNLTEENGKIAEELLKWKEEMRTFVGSQMTKSTPKRTP